MAENELGEGRRRRRYRQNTRRRDGELPEAATNLLAAAKTILGRDGFSGLTIDALAREAGEYRAAVRYYFGSKTNLIAALVESLTPQAVADAVAGVAERLPPGSARVRAQVAGWQVLADDTAGAQVLFEVFPGVVRDPELRRTVAQFYRYYRELDVRVFGVENEAAASDLQALAALLVAAIDGLTMQALLAPADVDIDRCFVVLADMVDGYLAHRRVPGRPLMC
ncbi:MAG: TetR/AcrR family transcriptional regulator [Thermoleophilia bacterium]